MPVLAQEQRTDGMSLGQNTTVHPPIDFVSIRDFLSHVSLKKKYSRISIFSQSHRPQ
jgi:hypothetical protein